MTTIHRLSCSIDHQFDAHRLSCSRSRWATTPGERHVRPPSVPFNPAVMNDFQEPWNRRRSGMPRAEGTCTRRWLLGMKRLVIGVLACFSLVTPARGADPQPAPVALELGTLADGTYSRAWTLNDSGQVVGFSTVSPGPPMSLGVPFHPFSWTRAGGMIDLGTLGGRFGAMATAVNGAGQVVGTSWTPDDGFHPFSWTPAGGMIDLGSLGGLYASAAGVSSSGQVFGSSDTATGEQHIFSCTPAGGMIDLG